MLRLSSGSNNVFRFSEVSLVFLKQRSFALHRSTPMERSLQSVEIRWIRSKPIELAQQGSMDSTFNTTFYTSCVSVSLWKLWNSWNSKMLQLHICSFCFVLKWQAVWHSAYPKRGKLLAREARVPTKSRIWNSSATSPKDSQGKCRGGYYQEVLQKSWEIM